MKKLIVFAALMAVVATARAQYEVGTWTVTPRVGLNLSTLSEGDCMFHDMDANDNTHDVGLGPKLGVGFVVGVEGEYQIHKMIGIAAGLNYSQQGMRYDHDFTNISSGAAHLDYLTLPVTANVYVMRNLALKAGFQLGYTVYKSDGGASQYFPKGSSWLAFTNNGLDYMTSVSDMYRSFDLSIPIGASYDINDVWRVDLRYNFGLLDVTKHDLKLKNRVIQLTVGYRFELFSSL